MSGGHQLSSVPTFLSFYATTEKIIKYLSCTEIKNAQAVKNRILSEINCTVAQF